MPSILLLMWGSWSAPKNERLLVSRPRATAPAKDKARPPPTALPIMKKDRLAPATNRSRKEKHKANPGSKREMANRNKREIARAKRRENHPRRSKNPTAEIKKAKRIGRRIRKTRINRARARIPTIETAQRSRPHP